MKLFITKLLSFGLLYFSISFIVSQFTPYHYGNPWFSTKIQHLEKSKDEIYNVFFFGSSRVYRQINPEVFDSTFNSISREKLNSFNLGAPATFNPQSYYLLENFLNSDLSKDTKYCFIELMEVDLLSDYFMHEERTSYWQNSSDILFVGKSNYKNNQLSLKQKLKSIKNYSVSYLEKSLHIGHFGSQLVNTDYYNEKYLGVNNDGYYSLDYDYITTDNEVVKKHLSERKNSIIKKPELINLRKDEIMKAYNNISNHYDKVNLNRILELIQKSKQNEVELIFILSPRNGNQELINLGYQIPKQNFIDMSNPEKFGLLYSYENSFDVGHLNTQGALLYSKMIAVEFEKKKRTHH